MNVMEIYRSIQGEGALMGVPTTFVRFFACNLRCSWCDTKYSWSVREGGTWESISHEQVVERVNALETRHVVLTGGEPTLQKDLPQLAMLLKNQGHHLTIETNATTATVNIAGLDPNLVYGSHLHNGTCASLGGGHYQNVPGAGAVPPNELWLSSTADPAGSLVPNNGGVAHGQGSSPWAARIDSPAPATNARSIIVHQPGSGARIACADLA